MAEHAIRIEARGASESLRQVLMQWGQRASIEINVQDLVDLEASRRLLRAGTHVYVSHLPKQSFGDTLKACRVVSAAGFEPVPHVPVRLLASHREFEQLVEDAARCSVRQILLISGDYPDAVGPFSNVSEVLRSTDWRAKGIERISIGGHPEGHIKVPLDEIRRAEIEKARMVVDRGIEATFVTQFFFESAPFVHWVASLRSAGVTAGIRAGLAGPAKIATLLRFAMRCGVGPSVKALGSRPGAFAKLLGEHGPENLLSHLAQEVLDKPGSFQGLHMFCFGGYLRTCRWLQSLSSGNFTIDAADGLVVN